MNPGQPPVTFDDDNPEWTDEDVARARPAAELPPEVLAAFPSSEKSFSPVAYPAVIERGMDGFGVFFPDLPGCVSAGDTQAEAFANAGEALKLHLAGMQDDGTPFPPASALYKIKIDAAVDEVMRVTVFVPLAAPAIVRDEEAGSR